MSSYWIKEEPVGYWGNFMRITKGSPTGHHLRSEGPRSGFEILMTLHLSRATWRSSKFHFEIAYKVRLKGMGWFMTSYSARMRNRSPESRDCTTSLQFSRYIFRNGYWRRNEAFYLSQWIKYSSLIRSASIDSNCKHREIETWAENLNVQRWTQSWTIFILLP